MLIGSVAIDCGPTNFALSINTHTSEMAVLLDLLRYDEDQRFDADVCIIGGGPAGIVIARQLIGSGLSVILAESGGRDDDNAAMTLYEGFSVGHNMDLTMGRFRVLGGASTRWGGRCALLDRVDFKRRNWIDNSGWPISFEDLRPYYDQALRLCNFKEPWLEFESVCSTLGLAFPSLATGGLVPYVWRVAAPDITPNLISRIALGYRASFDFGKAYIDELEAADNVRLLLHANLVELEAEPGRSSVSRAVVSTLDGRRATLTARRFVISCSGIENPRILLALPEPLLSAANAHDQIGRYFAQHPRGTIGVVKANRHQAQKLQETFNNFLRPRRVPVQYEVGLALSEVAQSEHEILNASLGLYYEVDDEAIWKAGRRVRDALKHRRSYSGLARDLMALAVGAPLVGVNIIRRFILGREVIHGNPTVRAVIDLEQTPRPESRITLSPERDRLGMPKAVVDWKVGELERKTCRVFAGLLDAELRAAGLGTLVKAQWLDSTEPVQSNQLYGNLHFIGATRMSDDPRTGVVDANCRVFGVDNLYVAGASVFSTGGHANPMVSIVALAARLADHLKGDALPPKEMLAQVTSPATVSGQPKVLVIGAGGFTGCHVVQSLLVDGSFGVIPGVHTSTPGQAFVGAYPVRHVELTDPASLRMAMTGCVAVVNCARTPAGEVLNRRIMSDLIDAARAAGVSRVIQLSSIAAYGAAPGEVGEGVAPLEPINPYGRDKLAAEAVCRDGASAALKIAVLRPTLIYGRGGEEWTDYFIRGLRRGKLKRLEGNGEGIANLVYVRDLADFCVHLLTVDDLPDFSVSNVNGDDLVTFNEYFEILSRRVVGRDPGTLRIARWHWTLRRTLLRTARAAAKRVPGTSRLLGLDGVMFIDDGYAKYAGRTRYPNSAAKALGFAPRFSVDEGVADMTGQG